VLKQTFCHLPGIGTTTEQRLWREGIRDWPMLIESGYQLLHAGCVDAVRCAAEETMARFEHRDWKWFDATLPPAIKWRAFGELGHQALYVDIETDGGFGAEAITVIGAFDGTTTQIFVADRNLEAARELIERYPLVVTFNGQAFDMPLIRERFRYNLFNHIHVDLRFPLQRLGLRGGLKTIEHQVGLKRPTETQGLNGWDAVQLWQEWQTGSVAALDLLLAYNREDVINLAPLMQLAFERMKSSCV